MDDFAQQAEQFRGKPISPRRSTVDVNIHEPGKEKEKEVNKAENDKKKGKDSLGAANAEATADEEEEDAQPVIGYMNSTPYTQQL